jgi:hypothetical protein
MPQTTLLLNLRQNLRILKQIILLKKTHPSAPLNTTTKATHLFSHFNRIAAPPRQQHPITALNRHRHDSALLIHCTRSDSNDRRFWEWTGRRGSREEYPRCRFLRKRYVTLGVQCQIRTAGKSVLRTVSCLKRWTRTRSRRGTRDLIDLNVA